MCRTTKRRSFDLKLLPYIDLTDLRMLWKFELKRMVCYRKIENAKTSMYDNKRPKNPIFSLFIFSRRNHSFCLKLSKHSKIREIYLWPKFQIKTTWFSVSAHSWPKSKRPVKTAISVEKPRMGTNPFSSALLSSTATFDQIISLIGA